MEEEGKASHGEEAFERTLVLVKPNAVSKSRAIESLVRGAGGLHVLKRRRTHLKPEQCSLWRRVIDLAVYYRIYRDLMAAESPKSGVPDIRIDEADARVEDSDLEDYVAFMTSGPVELWIVGGRGAVARWRHLMGPEDPRRARALRPDSVRAQFGGEDVLRNGVWGSESGDRAEQEIAYFFPDLGRRPDERASGEYLSRTVNPILLKGLIQLCRQRPDNPLVWLADWLLANNPAKSGQ